MDIHELELTKEERPRFIAEVKKRLSMKGWKAQDLADATGYTRKSIYQFFNNSAIKNRFIAAKISNVLKIERKDYK